MNEVIAEAHRRLSLTSLMQQLGDGEHAAKSARCPFHEDSRASFSVFIGTDGRERFHCHAGCGNGDSVDYLARKLNLNTSDALSEFVKRAGVSDEGQPKPKPYIQDTYDYRDETGQLLFQVVRFQPKDFRQRHPAPNGKGWIWNLKDVRRVLYRLPETIAAVQAGETIYVCEGELDVHSLVDHGLAATCNPGGAGKWLDDYSTTLSGANVVIIPDRDSAGAKHGHLVFQKLHPHAAQVHTLELPTVNGSNVKDPTEYFAAGGTAAELQTLATRTDEPTADPADSEPEEEPERPPFPMDALPPTLALIAKGIARTARVPERLTGPCVLGVVSAAIGAGLEVRSGPSRTTRANLYLMVSAESGTGKTSTFERIAAPLLDFQRDRQEIWRDDTNPRLRAELALLKREIESLEKKAPKTDDPHERERIRGEIQFKLALQDKFTQQNVEPVLLAQDITTERLASMVHEHGEVMFSASSDCRKVIDNLMGRYANSDTTDESFYLAGYSGDHVRVDRGNRAAVNLHRPCLGLLWFGQPDLVDNLFGADTLAQSGFLPRLLLCHSEAKPQPIVEANENLSGTIQDDWQTLVTALLSQYRLPPKSPANDEKEIEI